MSGPGSLRAIDEPVADGRGNGNFARNLHYLCSYYRSVSEVCRRIGINRQQFGKYLDGAARPSAHNLKRICDFFGLEEFEILFPPRDLKRLVEIKGLGPSNRQPSPLYQQEIQGLLAQNNPAWRDYCGYYYKYYYSFSYPGRILKSLLAVFELDGMPYYKCIERLVAHGDEPGPGYVFKYRGIVLFLRDRIFMIDREALIGNEISQTVLYPSYKSRISELPGLMLGVSGKTSREPVCSRVLLDYLGTRLDLRQTMRQCGLYAADAPEIDASVKRAIDNSLRPGEYTIRALPL